MSADPSQDRTTGPLGPAVSPRSAAPHPGFASPSEPLAPFHARPTAPQTNTAPAAEPEMEVEPPEPQAEREPEQVPAPGMGDLPWLYLAEEERVVEPEAPAAEPYTAEEETAEDVELIEPVAGLEQEPPEPAATPEPRRSDALARVAERLEAIARSLRERDPADLSLDPSDPLQLLITGYALGYAEANEEAEAERP